MWTWGELFVEVIIPTAILFVLLMFVASLFLL